MNEYISKPKKDINYSSNGALFSRTNSIQNLYNNEKHNKSIKILAEELANLVGVEGTMDIDILHDSKSKNDSKYRPTYSRDIKIISR